MLFFEKRMLTVITTVPCVIGYPEQCSEIKQRNKMHRDGGKCIKQNYFLDNKIIYVENTDKSTDQLLIEYDSARLIGAKLVCKYQYPFSTSNKNQLDVLGSKRA